MLLLRVELILLAMFKLPVNENPGGHCRNYWVKIQNRLQVYDMINKAIRWISLVLIQVMLIGFSVHASASGHANYGAGTRASDYNTGKKIFFEQVVCSTCPYSDLNLNATEVAAIRPALETSGDLGQFMSLRDRRSVQYFISKRFNL